MISPLGCSCGTSKVSEYFTNELIINFSPIIFNFIHLDDNLFDWIEKIIDKKCIFCSEIIYYYYICLICGKRMCHIIKCDKYNEHSKNCCGEASIVIRIDNMKAYITSSNKYMKELFPLYVNEYGVGPFDILIGNEFKLSHEKVKLAIKTYVCNDFLFGDG